MKGHPSTDLHATQPPSSPSIIHSTLIKPQPPTQTCRERPNHITPMPSPRSHLSPPQTFLLTLCSICLFLFLGRSSAQATTEPITDPDEATIINLLFDGWGISSSDSNTDWNNSISGGPCSGAATDDFTSLDDEKFNPGIKCNCSFDNMTTCRITELKAVSCISIGIIPEYIKNLTNLRKLNVHENSLSGTIPKELGNLHNLVALEIGMNNFSGSLPVELGTLSNLQIMRLDSLGLGVGGDIPPTFVKLQNLEILWVSDNNFTGSIPDFIGNLTELTDLRLHGNSFQGPIPSSFSNLTKLTYLCISELSNVSLNLEFISRMDSLNTLILRNNKLSGTIPSRIAWPQLRLLDLSFNNLTGTIPQSLFSLSSLKYLFLGNNSLSGALPNEKSPMLSNIDLSYNDLSGSFPSWVRNTSLNLNLVANNFNIDKSNESILPGLRCLQKNTPCYHGSANHSSFAINCGASQPVTVSNQPSYVTDNEILGAASLYVSGDQKWAVSNVGKFADVNDSNYIQSVLTRFLDSQNSELFQAIRLSPSSLRYFGLGLYNGAYSVQLQFGETYVWKPFGRRFFDIYIQGVLREENFNIYMKAGNKILTTVTKHYNVVVSNNLLEIHFFWAGKGTCCVPDNGTYGPSISAISVTRTDVIDNKQTTSAQRKKNNALIAGISSLAVALCFVLILGAFLWKRKKRQFRMSDNEDLLRLTTKPNIFSHTELKTATEDFSESNKLGEGGFGPVYKGILSDGREVAVKKLSVASPQGKRQFITEIDTISAVQHRNLVKLYGCCYEGDRRLLVYEYLANRSLDQVLFGNSSLHLDWQARYRICLGMARGLAYLHEESSVHIVHRDVKASNILLDVELKPKVSDFGLAKLRDDTESHISTGVAGTIGYLAPEYAMRGQLTEKADVFGFGVVALEILCGRRNTDPSLGAEKMYLLEWAWRLHEEKRGLEMMDPTISSYSTEEATRVIGVAFLCTQASPMRRPSMSRVVAMLVGDMEVSKVLVKPSYLMDWRYTEVSSSLTTGSSLTATTFGKEDRAFMGLPLPTTEPILGIGEER